MNLVSSDFLNSHRFQTETLCFHAPCSTQIGDATLNKSQLSKQKAHMTIGANRRLWLLQELKTRQFRNKSYSLRAFAHSLGISPASLSKILTGKRELSLGLAEKIAERCLFSTEERRNFFAGIQEVRPVKKQASHHVLEIETLAVIADWYHYAILSLAKLRNQHANATWIAGRLGISKRDAQSALERLITHGLSAEKRLCFSRLD